MITQIKKQYMKEWREKNKERIRQYMRKWEEEHKEERKKYNQKHHKEWWDKKKNNPEVKERMKKNLYRWRKENPDKVKIQKMNQHQRERYRKIFPKWGNNPPMVCEICGGKNKGRSLAIDHNHKTGEIRGLLCNKCNTMLGLVDEDIEIFIRMIDYLLTR